MGSSFLPRVLSFAAIVLAVLQAVYCQCRDYRSEGTTVCSILFQRFQSALVGSELNLYNLRKTFSPASRPAPILVNVSYEISFGYVPDNLCPGADNDSTLFNTSETQYLIYGWTSSVLYTFIHPAELNRLQPQLVFLFLNRLEVDPNNPVATALTWDGTAPISTAQLSLYIPSLPCSPSEKEVYNTLQDITSLLNIYTNVRTNLTTWNTEDTGYVINGSAFSTDASNWQRAYPYSSLLLLYLFCFILSFCLAFIPTLVITLKIEKMNSGSDKFKIWHTIFWTSVGILLQFSVLLLMIDLVEAGKWCSVTGCGEAALLKILWIILTVLFSVLSPLFFFLYFKRIFSDDTVPFLEVEKEKPQLLCPPILSHLCFVFCHFCGTSKCATVLFRFVLFPTLLMFSSILFHYSLPVLLLLVTYPIKVAALYSFLIAALILYILVAFYGEYKRVLQVPPGSEKWNLAYSSYYLCFSFINMLLIIVILSLFVSVYYVVSGGYYENSVFRAIVSFLPSLLLSSFIWFFRKKVFLKWMLEKKQEDTSDVAITSQTERQEEHSKFLDLQMHSRCDAMNEIRDTTV